MDESERAMRWAKYSEGSPLEHPEKLAQRLEIPSPAPMWANLFTAAVSRLRSRHNDDVAEINRLLRSHAPRKFISEHNLDLIERVIVENMDKLWDVSPDDVDASLKNMDRFRAGLPPERRTRRNTDAKDAKIADLERRLAEAENRVEHQGLKNYVTFLVWTTINNDRKYRDRIVGFAREAWAVTTQESEAKTPEDLRADIEIKLSDVIEAWVETYVERLVESTRMPFVADLVRVGFSGVDFREIAALFVDNVLEQDDYAWQQIEGR